MRKVLALLLSLVMTLTLLVPATWAEEKTATGYQLPASLKGKTVILHTNDVHGAIDKYAKVAALKNECYDRGASAVVLLDAGDFSQGSTYVSLSKGATAVELMNAVGYDAVTLGNHEFDYGFPQLKANLSNAAADFLVTCVNLVDDKGDPIFAPGATAPVTDADGNPLFNLTVMGVATPETQTKANPALMKGLTFLSGQKLYDAANAVIKVAREEGNADIVIALTHLGVDASSEPNRSIDFVKNVPGVDIVIDGHSHTVMTANKDNGMIQSTGTGLAYVGAFVIDNATKSVESNGLIDLSTYTKEDASVKAIADKIIGAVDAEYGKVFAKTEVELNGAEEPGNRTEETNMGDLITDAMMWAVKTRMPSINMENAVAITRRRRHPCRHQGRRHHQEGRVHRSALRQYADGGECHRCRAAGGAGGFYLLHSRASGRLPPDRRHEADGGLHQGLRQERHHLSRLHLLWPQEHQPCDHREHQRQAL